MSALTIELPSQEEQIDFNLRRWAELIEDPVLAAYEGRVETDRHGHVIAHRIQSFEHGCYIAEIGIILESVLTGGRASVACPVSTPDGVKVSDVVWVAKAQLASASESTCLSHAPDICVEVLSFENTLREMNERKALYFAAGATEVWFCSVSGEMTFFAEKDSPGEAMSRFCPQFPAIVQL